MKALLRISIRYGIIGGVLASLALLILFLMDKHPFLLPIIFDFRIVIFSVFIFLSLKEFRDYHQQGILYFWQGMIGSYVLIVTCGVIGSLFVWALGAWSKTFVSSFVEKLLKQFHDHAAEFIERVGKEAYEQQLAKLPGTTAGDLAADYFLKSLIIGLFLTIILSVILRRQPKP